MKNFMLLILLSSLWVTHLTHGCDTGVAFVKSVLSVPRSLMANADVAVLKAYNATTVQKCMEDCCSGTYGSCSVASFKRNSTDENCLHFYCRPLSKCKFIPSNSTDSFSFSNNPIVLSTTPSSNLKKSSTSTAPPPTREEIATYSDEGHKNDNTTVQARKGVNELTPDTFQGKSGVKPRKGVSIEDVPHSQFLMSSLSKSNVKPRKGVEQFSSSVSQFTTVASSAAATESSKMSTVSTTQSVPTKDFLLSLEKVFEDDPLDFNFSKLTLAAESSSAPSTSYAYETSSMDLLPSETSSVANTQTLKTPTPTRQFVSEAVEEMISTSTFSTTALPMNRLQSTTQPLIVLPTKKLQATIQANRVPGEFSTKQAHHLVITGESLHTAKVSIPEQFRDHKLEETMDSEEETENEKKYTSSIHLVLTLVFGLVVLFVVIGVIAKRVYDGWVRRDYHRMNYLIDGIYNGMD